MIGAADGMPEIKFAEIVRGGYRLVGWGTGSVFDFYDELYPLPLEYLIDNDASRHGGQRAGLQIFDPRVLDSEDPSKTAIIIYSSYWPEIAKQIAGIGQFLVIPVTRLHNREWILKINEAHRFAEAKGVKRFPLSDNAIVVQGPVFPHDTALALRFYAAAYPNDWIILSTWEDTDEKLLHEVRPFVDECILSRRPENAGVKNRNYQIVSTRAGLERASQLKCRFALKTRTDFLVAAKNVIRHCRHVLHCWDSVVAQHYGLEGRILVPSSFTRKYFLYHPSDLFMAGHVGDLLKFWQADLDTRAFDVVDACRRLPLKRLSMDGLITECYLGQSFAKRIGWNVAGELSDSWRYYRDLFLIMDNSWAGLCWFKNPNLMSELSSKPWQATVDHYFWQSLYFDNSYTLHSSDDPDISVQTWYE